MIRARRHPRAGQSVESGVRAATTACPDPRAKVTEIPFGYVGDTPRRVNSIERTAKTLI
jgi:hypothetical protein